MNDGNKIYDKFDHDVLRMLIFAKAASLNAKVDCIYPECFIIGMLATGKNLVTSMLLDQNIDLEKCLKIFKTKLSKRKIKKDIPTNFESLKRTKQVDDIVHSAYQLAVEKDQELINLNHVFLSTLTICAEIKVIFEEEGLNIKAVHNEIKKDQKPNKKEKPSTKEPAPSSSNSKNPASLESFCTNLTDLASKNKLDPIIARDEEIEEAITILCRRNKSNPILVGQPGVGKSAIVEGIAQRIVSNTVPKKLRGTKIYSLNIGCLVAGTKYRGDFEKRLQDLLKELKDDPTCILFVDEIHTIIGAGSASGSIDAANMLKPALARDLRCIGATTNAEYKKYFVGDGALERRFEKVEVEEPNQEQVKRILLGVKPRLESYHKCVITDDAINASIKLTSRYCADKNFPDKAIDCIDTACAKYAWKEENSDSSVITPSDIAMVVSKKTQIPMEVMLWDNFERVKNTEKVLRERIIGQEHAVKSICRTLRNAYSGIRNPEKPIGIFMFGGQSGTGKTYLAKELAKILFSSDSSFIRIDMSEYSEPHSISKIIGSPPGYVGFNEIDVVADKIRRKPYCVLLVDEMEKAHPDVIKLFLQVMSDGKFTDAIGNNVNCKNMILIFTGNFGMNEKGAVSIGFNKAEIKHEIEIEQQRLIDYCKSSYGAEFVNRIDDFVAFTPLSDESLESVTRLRLHDFLDRIQDKNCEITFHDDVPKQIVALSKKEHGMNANMINRLIEKNLETCVADAILELGQKVNDMIIEISIKDDKFNITYKVQENDKN
jgi:ATP-dependent Clp protease ATP-binding subunit ClpC